MPDKLSLNQLMSGEVSRAGELDDATIDHLLHIDRFLAKLRNSMPNPNLPVRDVLTNEEVRAMWKETADPNVDVGRCPMLN
jgi:hypothetical protein